MLGQYIFQLTNGKIHTGLSLAILLFDVIFLVALYAVSGGCLGPYQVNTNGLKPALDQYYPNNYGTMG